MHCQNFVSELFGQEVVLVNGGAGLSPAFTVRGLINEAEEQFSDRVTEWVLATSVVEPEVVVVPDSNHISTGQQIPVFGTLFGRLE